MQGIDFAASSLEVGAFLPEALQESEAHQVKAVTPTDEMRLAYLIETDRGPQIVIGTEQARRRITEIKATAALRERSTTGAVAESLGERLINLVQTPVRLSQDLWGRLADVDDVGDALTFAPVLVYDVSEDLIDGTGEMFVTVARITTAATQSSCDNRQQCLNEAFADIGSGINSLAGKHNDARVLHAEFGTDPGTLNAEYRREIDRLSYATSYFSTALKLGGGQAGIPYVSPAFVGVGYVNNAEFVGQYKDAHRQRNFEKHIYRTRGFDEASIEAIYSGSTYSKQMRRQVFQALQAIEDEQLAAYMFEDLARAEDRYRAGRQLQILAYMSDLLEDPTLRLFSLDGAYPIFQKSDGSLLAVTQRDYATWQSPFSEEVASLQRAAQRRPISLHVLGAFDSQVLAQAKAMNVHPSVPTR